MKITPDRLAVAWAVQEHIEFLTGESFDLYPEEVIESLPEPPDDSECVVCTGKAKLCRKHDLPTPLTTDDSPATLPDAILEGEVKVRNYEGRVTARDLWVAELVLRRWGAGSKIRRGSVLDLIAAESPEPEPLPAPTEWRTRCNMQTRITGEHCPHWPAERCCQCGAPTTKGGE